MSYESNDNGCTVLGPWGGQNGIRWDDGICSNVRQIFINYGAAIESIQIEYDMLGAPVLSDKHGGNGGIKTNKVKLDFPNEFLVSMSGYYGSIIENGPTLVRSLMFVSNKRKYGPFGIPQGTYFWFPASSEIVVGFYGRSSWYLDSIGVYLKPMLYRNLISNLSRISELHRNKKQDYNNVSPHYKVIKQIIGSGSYGGGIFDKGRSPGVFVKEEASTYMLGPWGGEGGKAWNDGEFSGIKKIYLTKGEAIYCMQTEYDRNGKSFWIVRHGGGSEGNSYTINFDYPHEVLTGICGYHDSFTGDARKSVVKSLTFITNKGKYGPYGEETGTFFSSSNTSEGKIIGFHGRSGCYLNSIGVHFTTMV